MTIQFTPIMFAGTGSDVGKSIITAGFCRIFLQDGYHPAPFKAQNMSSNSFVTPEGFEMSRAQVVQAEAAKIPCHPDMNPLVLKPSSDKICHVILNGVSLGDKSAYAYFKTEGREPLRRAVHEAFARLASKYHPIVLEGAGSISEINLRDTDLVNMPMAMHAKAAVILVADIDRGGVFASIYGSIMLLNAEERKHIKGIIINKFRGDLRLFESGIKMLEDLCQVPVLGVLPYFRDIYIDEEDSLQLNKTSIEATHNKVNVVVVLLKHMANFTDVSALEQDPRVHLYYSQNIHDMDTADIIILPSSSNPFVDLYELRKKGIASALIKAHGNNKTILGLGTGLYMMGETLENSVHADAQPQTFPGLNLLPLRTKLTPSEPPQQIQFSFNTDKNIAHGYLLKQGKITPTTADFTALNLLENGTQEGCIAHPKCLASTIHGLLTNPHIIDFIIAPYSTDKTAHAFDFDQYKDQQYDKLADHIRQHIDMEKIYAIMHQPN